MVSGVRPGYHPREIEAFLGDPTSAAERAFARFHAASDPTIDPLDSPLHDHFEPDAMLRSQLIDQNLFDLRDNVRHK